MTSTTSKIPKERRGPGGTYDLNQKPTGRRLSFSALVKQVLEIPKSAFCKLNYYYEGGRKAFPGSHHLWTVDRFYPHTEPTPMAVDLCFLPYKKKNALEKHKYFADNFDELGIHYIALDEKAEILDLENLKFIDGKGLVKK